MLLKAKCMKNCMFLGQLLYVGVVKLTIFKNVILMSIYISMIVSELKKK